MKRIVALIYLGVLFAAPAYATAPCLTGVSQTPGQCSPAIDYAVTLTTSDALILDFDKTGDYNCFIMQALSTNAANVCFAFGAVANATNGPCEELTPGAPYYIYNLPTGNGAPRVPKAQVHALVRTGTGVLTFRYCL